MLFPDVIALLFVGVNGFPGMVLVGAARATFLAVEGVEGPEDPLVPFALPLRGIWPVLTM